MDHRGGSPGVPDEVVTSQGLPAGAGRDLFESATITCNHCERVVVLRPDRKQPRGYCQKCDHYICDICEVTRVATGVCYPFKAMCQDILEKLDKGRSQSEVFQSPLIIP